MNNLSERVIAYIKYKGMTIAQFEQSCELGNGTISSLSSKTRKSTLNRIISFYPDLSLDWLLTGEGEMLRPIIRQEFTGNNSTSMASNSNHIANAGNDLAEKFLAETAEMRKLLDKTIDQNNERLNTAQQQITKSQEQIDRLLTFIERMQNKI